MLGSHTVSDPQAGEALDSHRDCLSGQGASNHGQPAQAARAQLPTCSKAWSTPPQ